MGQPISLSVDDQRTLLALARLSVEYASREQEPPALPSDLPGALRVPAGAFVTLYAGRDLRGCVGTFDTTRQLADVVRSMGVTASLHDTRFQPVRPDEVDALDLSISVLTPAYPLASRDEIVIGRHGLIVSQGHRRGVLLPKVATERGWSAAEFLVATCQKAGLPGSAAETFGEPGGIVVDAFEAFDLAEKDLSA